MKQLLLLTSALLLASVSFAQSAGEGKLQKDGLMNPSVASFEDAGIHSEKATKNGDTIYKVNFISTDSIKRYVYKSSTSKDSGYVAGMNYFGDKGFAERFDIKSPDSSVLVLGVGIWFIGTVSATSTQAVTVTAWNQGPVTQPFSTRTHLYFTGVPTTAINTLVVPVTTLRKSSGSIDSFRLFKFASPGTTYVSDSFFVGYIINSGYNYGSLTGDTIGAAMTQTGTGRHQPGYIVRGADTVINVQNATQLSNGTWVDNLNGTITSGHLSIYNGYIMEAFFKVKSSTGVNSITRNDLTVFGTYPNPAGNSAKLKLALKSATTVSLQILDATGRTVYTAVPEKFSVGEHELNVPTAQLAAGTYYCFVHTAEGDGMGIEMTVAK